MRISVFASRELQGVIVSMKAMPRELAKQIRQQTKRVIEPEWKQALAERADTRLEHRVLVSSARVAVSDQNVVLRSGGVGRSLQGGVKPSAIVAGTEFGANRDKVKSYTTRSRNGTSYTVKRHTQRQFRARAPKGRVAYQAAAEVIPRLASLWVQTTVRTFYEAAERK